MRRQLDKFQAWSDYERRIFDRRGKLSRKTSSFEGGWVLASLARTADDLGTSCTPVAVGVDCCGRGGLAEAVVRMGMSLDACYTSAVMDGIAEPSLTECRLLDD